MDKIKNYVAAEKEAVLNTLRELCRIPAPSHHEEKRAEYCKNWLERHGAEGVYIDEALNVVYPLNCEGSNEITVFVAHTDTVFPDQEPLPYSEDEEKIYCPGASDDTASVAVLLSMAKYFIAQKLQPKGGILFVCNSCEEGLGNLKGTRRIFADYAGRIKQFISLDSLLTSMADRCVGSHRYEVTVRTKGGHSYSNFGNENAIAVLAGIIREIYAIAVPEKEGSKTTYNVGTIEGGTSVNTIAQSAKMLCEYRSDHSECLAEMEAKFKAIFAAAQNERAEILIERVGERPCGIADPAEIKKLADVAEGIIEDVIGQKPVRRSSSTDCNIPLSLGVPALCIGVNLHAGIHTREEWVDKASLTPGLEIALRFALALLSKHE